jgi:hypothetical protein
MNAPSSLPEQVFYKDLRRGFFDLKLKKNYYKTGEQYYTPPDKNEMKNWLFLKEIWITEPAMWKELHIKNQTSRGLLYTHRIFFIENEKSPETNDKNEYKTHLSSSSCESSFYYIYIFML